MKRACAKKAFEWIRDDMAIGLGGGEAVAFLIEELAKSKKRVTAVSPSGDTLELCKKSGIPTVPLSCAGSLELAFDGCDTLDRKLNALKSRGGIHTREKLVAAMAKEYILLADESKLTESLTFCVPVAVEALRPAKTFVTKQLEAMGAAVYLRKGSGKAGCVRSDDGNDLLDAVFPEKTDPEELSGRLDGIAGIVGHSLFCKIADGAIVAKADGTVEVIRRERRGTRRQGR